MSADSGKDVSHPRMGPARAIFEIDQEDYPDAASAIRAALEQCPVYRCKECGRERYGNARNCMNCGGGSFLKITHQENTSTK